MCFENPVFSFHSSAFNLVIYDDDDDNDDDVVVRMISESQSCTTISKLYRD